VGNFFDAGGPVRFCPAIVRCGGKGVAFRQQWCDFLGVHPSPPGCAFVLIASIVRPDCGKLGIRVRGA
jgi:hypothetical protein